MFIYIIHGSCLCQVPVIKYMQFHKYPLLQLSPSKKKKSRRKGPKAHSVALSSITIVCRCIKKAATVKTKAKTSLGLKRARKVILSIVTNTWFQIWIISVNLPVQSGPTKALDKCKYYHTGRQCWKKYFLKQFLTLMLGEKKKNLLHFKFTEHLNVLKTFSLIFIASIRYISILY